MATDSIRHKIGEATAALRHGKADGALKIADEIVGEAPDSAEGQQLRGIALTRLNDLPGATDAFRQATVLAPDEPKHFYNLAVNLRDRKMPDEAMANIERALQLDPVHRGARQLRIEMTGEDAPAPGYREIAPGPLTPRKGFTGPRHLLPILAGMEPAWALIGYAILAMDALLAVLMLVHLPMHATGLLTPGAKLPDVELRHDNLSIFIVFLYIVAAICTFMWMFVDVIDLRRKFSWLVPIIACTIPGFAVLPLALYMVIGRQLDQAGST